MLKEYLTAIFKTAQQGDATEPSYFPALKDLLHAFAESSGKAKVQVTAFPKKTEAGNPDFKGSGKGSSPLLALKPPGRIHLMARPLRIELTGTDLTITPCCKHGTMVIGAELPKLRPWDSS